MCRSIFASFGTPSRQPIMVTLPRSALTLWAEAGALRHSGAAAGLPLHRPPAWIV